MVLDYFKGSPKAGFSQAWCYVSYQWASINHRENPYRGLSLWTGCHNKQEQQKNYVGWRPSNFPGRLQGSFNLGVNDNGRTSPSHCQKDLHQPGSMKFAQQRSFSVKYLKLLPWRCKLGHVHVCKGLQTLVCPLFKPVPVLLDWQKMSTWKNFSKKSWLWSLLLKCFSNGGNDKLLTSLV